MADLIFGGVVVIAAWAFVEAAATLYRAGGE
jgi:hypothetical protein